MIAIQRHLSIEPQYEICPNSQSNFGDKRYTVNRLSPSWLLLSLLSPGKFSMVIKLLPKYGKKKKGVQFYRAQGATDEHAPATHHKNKSRHHQKFCNKPMFISYFIAMVDFQLTLKFNLARISATPIHPCMHELNLILTVSNNWRSKKSFSVIKRTTNVFHYVRHSALQYVIHEHYDIA